MAFFNSAVGTLQTIVIGLAALCAYWAASICWRATGRTIPALMLMYGRGTTTKTKQGQPPRLYSEQEGHRFFCNYFMKSIENYNAECYNVLEQ